MKIINSKGEVIEVVTKDLMSVNELNGFPTNFVIPNATYTKLKYANLTQLGGTSRIVSLVNNVAKVNYDGVYRITINQVWLDIPSNSPGSFQIRIGDRIILSLANSSIATHIFGGVGIVKLKAGDELPVLVYQSTGKSVTLNYLYVAAELIYKE